MCHFSFSIDVNDDHCLAPFGFILFSIFWPISMLCAWLHSAPLEIQKGFTVAHFFPKVWGHVSVTKFLSKSKMFRAQGENLIKNHVLQVQLSFQNLPWPQRLV